MVSTHWAQLVRCPIIPFRVGVPRSSLFVEYMESRTRSKGVSDKTKKTLLRYALVEIETIKRHVSPAHQLNIDEICSHLKSFESDYLEPRRFEKVAKLLGGASILLFSSIDLLDSISKLDTGGDHENLINELYYGIFEAQYRPLIRALPRKRSQDSAPVLKSRSYSRECLLPSPENQLRRRNLL